MPRPFGNGIFGEWIGRAALPAPIAASGAKAVPDPERKKGFAAKPVYRAPGARRPFLAQRADFDARQPRVSATCSDIDTAATPQ